MKNLDLLAARAAQGIVGATASQKAKEVDNLVTKSLGVLQENGVYAGLLYLYSRSSEADRTIAEKVREQLLGLTGELGQPQPDARDHEAALRFMADHVCNDLDTLLLVKQVWEQTLIYARYGAKARDKAGE
jgi:hypothetical protein